MAIDAKMSFIKQIEERMSSVLTVSTMVTLSSAIQDVLESFDMREHPHYDDETDDMLNDYLSALKVQGRSQKTLNRYAYIIGKMMSFLGIQTRKVTVHHIRNYLSHEKERGVMDSTLEGVRQIFCSYFGWLHREGLIDVDPTANLGAIKVPKKEKKTYSEIDIERLNRACKTIRDRAIISFLSSTGCRISEMTSLNRDQINLNTLECVVHGKGNKERTVYLSEVTGMLLREYLKNRTDDDDALFGSRRTGRLTPDGVRCMLKKLGEETGIEKVHPHKFRRTFATRMTRHDMPIQEVAKLLGHDKLDTTMQYVVLNKDDIRASYRRYA